MYLNNLNLHKVRLPRLPRLFPILSWVEQKICPYVLHSFTVSRDASGGGLGLSLNRALKIGMDAAMIVIAPSAVPNIIKLMTWTVKY